MAVSKEQLVKDIMSIRRRKDVKKGLDIREIEIFEEQFEKSFRRIEQAQYIAKKFNQEELTQIYRAYDADRKSTRLNSSHSRASRMPSSA